MTVQTTRKELDDEQKNVTKALRALVGSESRSEMSRLREVFDEVETTLSAGVSRTAILEALNRQGFTMTAKSFESALYRLRKQRKAGKLPKAMEERVHGSRSNAAAEDRAATPQIFTPKKWAESESENTGNSAPGEQASIESVAFAGKTRTEQILATAPKAYSLKQLQQAKDSK